MIKSAMRISVSRLRSGNACYHSLQNLVFELSAEPIKMPNPRNVSALGRRTSGQITPGRNTPRNIVTSADTYIRTLILRPSNIDFVTNDTRLLTYLLTPWCRVLEQLTGLQLVKKFPAFHGTRRLITALTSVRHLSLSWASPIHSIYPHPTSWRSILIYMYTRAHKFTKFLLILFTHVTLINFL